MSYSNQQPCDVFFIMARHVYLLVVFSVSDMTLRSLFYRINEVKYI